MMKLKELFGYKTPRATKMKVLLATLTFFVAVLMPIAHCDSEDVAWCYHEPSCNDTVWISKPFGVCNGTRQSPINIETANVQGDPSLTAFTFNGFSENNAMKEIMNTGRTVKVKLGEGLLSVSGGGLPNSFNSLQFHLHWGNGSNVPGSEHTVDNRRYPMELHIVHINSKFNGNISLALEDPEGVAALGFFIQASNDTGLPASWKTLTSYLSNITNSGQYVNITDKISVDDLLEGVDRTKFYRYLGSLTTPNCQEVVVWTVFKDPIRVSKDLIDLFSTSVYVNTSSNSPLATNTYRRTVSAEGRVVRTQVSPTSSPPPSSAASKTSNTLGLLFLAMLPLLHRG
ncbi:hypothetical protein AAFF_G00406990 [Aldrovandia affinis]|uniref:Carbonic anhydrase n=1 Tax=Aldrovandia affinis TaxID=143900 RepID=A0AAD7SCC2_9TELE|nr:hypothetical protein AAFF_G00406990 [Aldrovandia affinis]